MRSVVFCIGVMMALAAVASADAVVGTSSGVFTNPTGDPGAPPFYTGVGTNQFGWGDATGTGTGPNYVRFAGTSINTVTDTSFIVGTFTYYNGTVASNTFAQTVDLDVTLGLTSPVVANPVFPFKINITTTLNNGDPAHDADILSLTNLYSTQNFVVGGNTYTLLLLGFVNPNVTQGFVDANGFHVYEGATGTADLEAKITLASNVVPEPATLPLLGGAICGALLVLRRLRR